jgi:hypothetical protein
MAYWIFICLKINMLQFEPCFAKVKCNSVTNFCFILAEMWIMSADIHEIGIRTADYFGRNRRYCTDRRLMPDRRSIIRFDHNGGDRRSGFAQRHNDEGFRVQDCF